MEEGSEDGARKRWRAALARPARRGASGTESRAKSHDARATCPSKASSLPEVPFAKDNPRVESTGSEQTVIHRFRSRSG
jgi:hypothetical protein